VAANADAISADMARVNIFTNRNPPKSVISRCMGLNRDEG